MPRMAPVTKMFKFPSWFTERSKEDAFSGVVSAGVVPDWMGTAP